MPVDPTLVYNLENSERPATPEDLRLEYDQTQEMAIHYDTLNWTIGSILIAGVFVSIGIIGDKIYLYPIMSFLSLVILLIWRFFYERHKAIQSDKFERLHVLDWRLGLQQHRMVDVNDKAHKHRGITGDVLAWIIVFAIPVSLLSIYLAHPLLLHYFPNGLPCP